MRREMPSIGISVLHTIRLVLDQRPFSTIDNKKLVFQTPSMTSPLVTTRVMPDDGS